MQTTTHPDAISDQNGATDRYYWQVMGMGCDPFAEDALTPYLSSEWQESIDLLQHLCQYSALVKVFMGAPKSGKTTFLQLFTEHTESVLRTYALSCQECATSEDLVHLVKARLGFSDESMGQTPQQMVQGLKDDSIHRVMVLDDAHLLSDDVLDFLKYWVEGLNGEMSHLHFVLCGDESLKSRLDDMDAKSWSQEVALKPLGLRSIETYLQDCLEQAEYVQDFPFSARDMREIVQSSKGWLPGVNQAARLILMDKLVHQGSSAVYDVLSRWMIPGLGLVTLVGGAGLIWQLTSSTTSLIEETKLSLAQPSNLTTQDPSSDEVAAVAPWVPLSPKKHVMPLANKKTKDDTKANALDAIDKAPSGPAQNVKIEQVLSKERMQVLDGPIELPGELPAKRTQQDKPPIVGKNVTEYQNASVVKHQPRADKDKTNADARTRIVIKPRMKEQERPVYRDMRQQAQDQQAFQASKAQKALWDKYLSDSEKNIMQQDRNDYTIQLLAGRREEALRRFIKKHQLKSDDVVYVRTYRGDSDWYMLIYGQYQNVEQARAHMLKLPKSLRMKNPWPRRFGTIQSQMQKRLAALTNKTRTQS